MNETHVSLEKLIPASGGSIFKLTILVAKRALQLADGDKALIDKPSEKVLDNVIAEILQGKIRIKQ